MEIINELVKLAATTFLEWSVNESWIVSSNSLWYQKSDGNPDAGITTDELYEMFILAERERLKKEKENEPQVEQGQ